MKRLKFLLPTLFLLVGPTAILIAVYRLGFRVGERAAQIRPLPPNSDRNLVEGQLRILAADNREPAAQCFVSFTLIDAHGGDGGYP